LKQYRALLGIGGAGILGYIGGRLAQDKFKAGM